jgi:tetratricopeptide (TPR) repeat protein
MSKLAKGAKDLVADRMAGPKSFEKVEQEEIKSEVDEVLDCMQLLLNGSGAVPSVLWLDDAQWIDDESLVFLHRLWKEAERRKWPLLVVATHWEREWRELAVAERTGDAGDTLHDFAGSDGVEVAVLENAARGALRACVVERLPGLTDAQQSLLVEKAGGNFLTMAENIGELLRHPANFVERDTVAALSPAGERKVEKWESVREKRVEQRFSELEPDVKDVLGWSSHLGQRFLREVVVEFAGEAAQIREARGLIERCVDPYVILGSAGEHLREFRDRAFHIVASRHFEDYGEEHREALSGVLRRHLVEWVNNSFSEAGDTIWPSGDPESDLQPIARSITGVELTEGRELVRIAIRELAMPASPCSESLEDAAAIRARYLLLEMSEAEWGRWSQEVTFHCFVRVNDSVEFWSRLPEQVLGRYSRKQWAKLALSAGTAGLAVALESSLLALLQPDGRCSNGCAPSTSMTKQLEAAEIRFETQGSWTELIACLSDLGRSDPEVLLRLARAKSANSDFSGAELAYEHWLQFGRASARRTGEWAEYRRLARGLFEYAAALEERESFARAVELLEELIAICNAGAGHLEIDRFCVEQEMLARHLLARIDARRGLNESSCENLARCLRLWGDHRLALRGRGSDESEELMVRILNASCSLLSEIGDSYRVWNLVVASIDDLHDFDSRTDRRIGTLQDVSSGIKLLRFQSFMTYPLAASPWEIFELKSACAMRIRLSMEYWEMCHRVADDLGDAELKKLSRERMCLLDEHSKELSSLG